MGHPAGLVEKILDDVDDQPGNLPLLSYALLGTWKRRSGREMTLAGYQAAGGVAKAISQTADRVFNDLTHRGLGDVARRIFLAWWTLVRRVERPGAGHGCETWRRRGGVAGGDDVAGPVGAGCPPGDRR